MYHRYMPNANGQYRRQTVQETKPTPRPSEKNAAPKQDTPAEVCEPKNAPARECAPEKKPASMRKDAPERETPPACRSARSGIRPMLFSGTDSGDLLLLALLLLLISEGNEDAGPTVLTLALALIL